MANVDPIVTLIGANSADEGDLVSYSYSTIDPGSEIFTLDAETCDGGTLSNSTFNSLDGSGSFDCTFADGPASYNVSVTVGDGTAADSDTQSVANVAPAIVEPDEQNALEERDHLRHGFLHRSGCGRPLDSHHRVGRWLAEHLVHDAHPGRDHGHGTHLRR